MDTHRTTARSSGLGFVGALTILFIALKLLGIITWPWVWVLAPLWITACLAIGFLLVIGAIGLLYVALKDGRR
jgi:hypothetical protein